tara:strand:+ start:251 stop:607 length:357 start_codon:yes stop_codon:yes gene_type:complete
MSKTDTGITVTEEMTLPKKFKENWINALTSGEYQQIQNSLCDEFGFCAIGVACNVAGIPEETLMNTENVNNDWIIEYNLPFILNKKNDLLDIIIDLNDSEYLDFNQIASFIDKNVEAI